MSAPNRCWRSSWRIMVWNRFSVAQVRNGGKMSLRAIKHDNAETTTTRHAADGLLTLHERKLMPMPSRVVIRPFHLGWQASDHSSSRAGKLVADILSLSDEAVHTEYHA